MKNIRERFREKKNSGIKNNKYKTYFVGDNVRIVSQLPSNWNESPYFTEEMNPILGEIGEVAYISSFSELIGVDFSCGSFLFRKEWIECKIEE